MWPLGEGSWLASWSGDLSLACVGRRSRVSSSPAFGSTGTADVAGTCRRQRAHLDAHQKGPRSTAVRRECCLLNDSLAMLSCWSRGRRGVGPSCGGAETPDGELPLYDDGQSTRTACRRPHTGQPAPLTSQSSSDDPATRRAHRSELGSRATVDREGSAGGRELGRPARAGSAVEAPAAAAGNCSTQSLARPDRPSDLLPSRQQHTPACRTRPRRCTLPSLAPALPPKLSSPSPASRRSPCNAPSFRPAAPAGPPPPLQPSSTAALPAPHPPSQPHLPTPTSPAPLAEAALLFKP